MGMATVIGYVPKKSFHAGYLSYKHKYKYNQSPSFTHLLSRSCLPVKE